MRRRQFLIVLGSATFACGRSAQSQQTKVYRIGLLDYSPPEAGRVRLWDAFRQQLRALGYVEGRNTTFETRWADGKADRLPALAAELVNLNVDLIVTGGTSTAVAAAQATTMIPIIMASGSEPVGIGLVSSLAKPGGNITGVTTLTMELSGKRMELLRELVPAASHVAILTDAGNLAYRAEDMRTAVQSSGLNTEITAVRGADEFEAAFAAMKGRGADALLVIPSPMFFGNRQALAELALKGKLPTVMGQREYVEAGGVLSYATNLSDSFRHAATYVDKVLNGAKPADLPIEQPTKFELVINLKTAKALGLSVPPSLLARADEVIE
jgi:putative ABC transport system substrate-binding protein